MSRLFSPSPFPLPLGEDQALGAWASEAALFLAWHMFRWELLFRPLQTGWFSCCCAWFATVPGPYF